MSAMATGSTSRAHDIEQVPPDSASASGTDMRGPRTPASERVRAWRAAQSPQDKERRRIARKRNRPLQHENDERRRRFELLLPDEKDQHRQRDRQRHAVLRRKRRFERTNQEIDELEAACNERDAADAAAADREAAAANADVSDAGAVEKFIVEVSEEIELSSVFIRASLDDRSDLFGPRPTVPLTKRARLRSYVDSTVKWIQLQLYSLNCVVVCTNHIAIVLFNAGTATSLGTPTSSCTRRRRSHSTAGHRR